MPSADVRDERREKVIRIRGRLRNNCREIVERNMENSFNQYNKT